MTRSKLLLLVGIAFTAVAVVVIGVIVTALVLRSAPPDPETERLSEHALTPQESITEVAPQRDGTVQIRQRLIFETPPEDGKPVGLWISTAGLGRILRPRPNRDDAETIFAERCRAEHSRRFDSTTEDTRELDIAVDEEREQGFDHPEVYFMINPKDSRKAAKWSEGRHVIELEYVLDEVFITVAGEEFSPYRPSHRQRSVPQSTHSGHRHRRAGVLSSRQRRLRPR